MLRICHTNLNQINLRKYEAKHIGISFLTTFFKNMIFFRKNGILKTFLK
jgi:hypothetical protein